LHISILPDRLLPALPLEHLYSPPRSFIQADNSPTLITLVDSVGYTLTLLLCHSLTRHLDQLLAYSTACCFVGQPSVILLQIRNQVKTSYLHLDYRLSKSSNQTDHTFIKVYVHEHMHKLTRHA
jgi:hypothetical protein